MSINQEFFVGDIRYVKSGRYDFVKSLDGIIQPILWPFSVLSLLLGNVYSPLFSGMLMRAISICNVFGHLNGPHLHSSDLLFYAVGQTALPLGIHESIRVSQEKMECKPPKSYSKTQNSYASCSIVDLYFKSILFYLLYSLPALFLSFKTYKSLQAHRKK